MSSSLSNPATTSNPTPQTQHQQQPSTTTMRTPLPLPLTLILAATPSRGIGRSGTLPWPSLPSEMSYFARVTKRTPPPSSSTTQPRTLNAVIMGRKTWDSIPLRFRPLKDRLNIVITRDKETLRETVDNERAEKARKKREKNGDGVAVAKDEADDVIIASSLDDAMTQLTHWESSNQTQTRIHRGFVIGGATLYSAALKLPQTRRVLLTVVREEFECDTFFELDLVNGDGSGGWKRSSVEEVRAWTGEGEDVVKEGGLEEKGVRFEFGMWVKEGGEGGEGE